MVNTTLRQQTRSETARPLPDFVVIGAMRAGTTLLHELLAAQAGFSLPKMKETDFFVREKPSAETSYARFFDLAADRCGEISPNYSKRDVFAGVPEQVRAANPDARLIYIVRDPVARAISQYTHSLLSGQEMPAPHDLLDSQRGEHIINTSRYSWQLAAWLEHFQVEQILVLDFDELTCNPAQSLGRLNAHLDLPARPMSVVAVQSNSSGQVARVPDWWLKLRDTGLGQRLRAMAPRGLAGRAKALASRGQAQQTLPEIPEAVRNRIADRLRDDAAAFRALTGMAFADWSV
ncbi:MAG: sulfotransferase domain-containing protein [Aquisalinus sp.]|nr:sulfotransferase domain-containing protein [Aquisalinus sp.]